MRIVAKHSSLKKAFQSDSAGTIAKNQTMEKAKIFLMKCNYLQCMFIQTRKFTNILQDITFHIVYINGHTRIFSKWRTTVEHFHNYLQDLNATNAQKLKIKYSVGKFNGYKK